MQVLPTSEIPPARLPLPDATWSARAFLSRSDAVAFLRNHPSTCRSPHLLERDTLGPDGQVIRAGTWVVAYRVFDADELRANR